MRALSAHLRALQTYFRVLQKADRVPEPRRASIEEDVERMVQTVLDVFRRHDVPVEAQREIHDLLVGRGTAPEAG